MSVGEGGAVAGGRGGDGGVAWRGVAGAGQGPLELMCCWREIQMVRRKECRR